MSAGGFKYTLEINERQAGVILDALDLLSRLLCGQTERLVELYEPSLLRQKGAWSEDPTETARVLAKSLKAIAFPELHPNASYGICAPDTNESAKIAYDILQVLRRCLAYSRLRPGEKRGWAVDFDEPLACSKEPLPRAEARKE